MKFDELVERFARRPFFELRELLALSDDAPKSLKNQISAWVQRDKVVRLRREKYLLNKPYRKTEPSVFYVANYLLRPSYVSRQTALQYHGLIPESVAPIQSVTPKHGNEWETPLGTFTYSSIKQERFWGYTEYSAPANDDPQQAFHMARPEKALLDLFYFEKGSWPPERLEAMRFQNLDRLEPSTFQEFAVRYDSPKVRDASENLLALAPRGLP